MPKVKKVNKTENANTNESLIVISKAQFDEMTKQGIDTKPFKVAQSIPKTHKAVLKRKTNLEIKLEAMEAQYGKEITSKYLQSCKDAQGVIVKGGKVVIKGKETTRDFQWVTTLKTCEIVK